MQLEEYNDAPIAEDDDEDNDETDIYMRHTAISR